MNETPKHQVDELFSGALDDALTHREQTELKRLLKHQPELAEQLEQLKRQRDLLNALPIHAAPETMLDDIKAQLERKLILDNATHTRGFGSRAALVRRRFTAAAAMLFLPLGLLGYVVYHITRPVEEVLPGRPTAQSLLSDEPIMTMARTAAPAAGMTLPFDGTLVLETDRPLLAAQSIEKQIFLKALEHQAVPDRTAEAAIFQIDCSSEAMADFVESLRPLWGQIAAGQLTVRDAATPEWTVVIDHIRPEQIQTLIRQTDNMPMLATARQYASSNVPLQAEAADALASEAPSVPQPILAWPQQETRQKQTDLPHVRLRIEVRRPRP